MSFDLSSLWLCLGPPWWSGEAMHGEINLDVQFGIWID
jgi:hypothetical protein